MPSIPVKELFREELEELLIPVFFGDRESVEYEELAVEEKRAINKVFNYGINQLRKVSPVVAKDIERQRGIALKVGSIFKAMLPGKKDYTFPSETGKLSASWLFPGAIRYVATASADNPAYSSYKLNSWDIDLTAGTAIYFFGDGTNFYKASPTTYKHSMLLVFYNGIVEIGSTPKLQAFRLYGEGVSKYGAYAISPIVEEEIEEGKLIYQYPTPLGATPIFFDKGIMWGAMPLETGTATIKLLGLVYYEHDLYPDLASTYIS